MTILQESAIAAIRQQMPQKYRFVGSELKLAKRMEAQGWLKRTHEQGVYVITRRGELEYNLCLRK